MSKADDVEHKYAEKMRAKGKVRKSDKKFSFVNNKYIDPNEEMIPQFLPTGTADYIARNLFPAPDPYRDDPVLWVKDKLGGFCWSKQKEIMYSVRDRRYTAVQSCHGPGKSWTAANVVSWWLDVHDLGSAFVVTTAPSSKQVSAILWREIRRTHKRALLRGRITLDNQWYMSEHGKRNRSDAEDELIAFGRKPADYDEDSFQGIHARYILIVIDEACGVPEQLYNATNALVTNEFARVLAIGNPDDPGSYFAKICKPGSGWNVIKISAFDTPNFTGEWIPPDMKHDLVSPIWVEDREREWSKESPLYVSKILGEFPDVSDENMFPPKLVSMGHYTELEGIETGRYGADIARMGRDFTVVYRNRGGQIRFENRWSKKDTMQTAGNLKLMLTQHFPRIVPMVVDIIGVGAGVYDRLREQDMPVVPHQGSEKAYRSDKFYNRRAEVYWSFREGLEQGLVDLDPEDDKLASQLGTIKYWVNSRGQIQVETKEEMNKRGVPSPDYADAAIMSYIQSARARDYVEQNLNPTIAGDLLQKVM